jgi:hypothetical protein
MSKNTNPGSGLATLDQFAVPDVIVQLDKQIKEIGNIETSSYKTNMDLPPFGNLKNVKEVETLVKAHSFISGKAARYDESVRVLNLEGTAKPFTENGYSLKEWEVDIQLQVKILTHKDRLAELKRLKKEAEQFISEEEKKAMFFKSLMNNPVLQVGMSQK